ncbi:MAG: ribonuclease E/G, partial [Terracoccus sp.]
MAPEDTNNVDTSNVDTSNVDTPEPVTAATAAPDVTAGASEPVAAATPPRKRASRATKSTTKKAAAPKDAETDAAAPRTAKKAAAKATTRTPRATRSATKKAAESVVQDVLPDGAAETAEGAESAANAESAAIVSEGAPVKKAVRKRATRKQAAPVVSSDASEAVRELVSRASSSAADAHDATDVDARHLPEPSEEPHIDPLSPGGAAPSTNPRDAVSTEPADETDEDAEEQTTAPPALSVLFQAPDAGQPAARAPGRRRRAAAPAGAPGTHETAAVVTAEQPPEQHAPVLSTSRRDDPGEAATAEHAGTAEHADESTEPAEGTESTESTESAEAVETTERPVRRSRSNRGGRSRRGRDTSDASSAAGAADAGESADAADAADSESTTDRGAGRRHDGRDSDSSDSSDSNDSNDTDQSDDTDTETADDDTTPRRSRRRRGGKGRRGRGGSDEPETESPAASTIGSATRESSDDAGDSRDAGGAGAGAGRGASRPSDDDQGDEESASSRRRRRRRRSGGSGDGSDESPNVSTRVRQPRAQSDEPVAVRGSTRLEAKKQRRREGREAGRRRTIITEAEFLARREAVDRVMVVRNKDGRTQMGVLEDGVLVEHYIDQATNVSMAGNIYLGRVQNVLPSMEAAFVDIGKGRNAVLYAGEVNWDAAGLEGNQPKRIENALGSGQAVLVQVTKDPIGHKGARLTSQISLPGRYLVYVPNSSMTGISRKLPDTERARLKKILRDVVPESAGVIVRTAAEGASEAELRADVERLTATWEAISSQAEAATTGKAGKSKGRKKNGGSGSSPVATAPTLLHGEPDLTVRVIRDVFNED